MEADVSDGGPGHGTPKSGEGTQQSGEPAPAPIRGTPPSDPAPFPSPIRGTPPSDPAPFPSPIRVVIAEDQDLIRASFALLVGATDGMEVVGLAATGREAVEVTGRAHPDVVLMDIRMPDMDGIEATGEITRRTDAKVIALTTFDLPEYVYGALRAGASGFLVKSASPAELLQAIRVVADGQGLLSPSVTAGLIADIAAGRGRATRALPAGLTARDRDVLVRVARGMSNEEIAADLVLSPRSVKTYVTRLLAKVHARTRVDLVVLAYETGLASPGRPPLDPPPSTGRPEPLDPPRPTGRPEPLDPPRPPADPSPWTHPRPPADLSPFPAPDCHLRVTPRCPPRPDAPGARRRPGWRA